MLFKCWRQMVCLGLYLYYFVDRPCKFSPEAIEVLLWSFWTQRAKKNAFSPMLQFLDKDNRCLVWGWSKDIFDLLILICKRKYLSKLYLYSPWSEENLQKEILQKSRATMLIYYSKSRFCICFYYSNSKNMKGLQLGLFVSSCTNKGIRTNSKCETFS